MTPVLFLVFALAASEDAPSNPEPTKAEIKAAKAAEKKLKAEQRRALEEAAYQTGEMPWSANGATLMASERQGIRLGITAEVGFLQANGFYLIPDVRYVRSFGRFEIQVGGAAMLGVIGLGGAPLVTAFRVRLFDDERVILSAEAGIAPYLYDFRINEANSEWFQALPKLLFSLRLAPRWSFDAAALFEVRVPYRSPAFVYHLFGPGAGLGFTYTSDRVGFFLMVEGQVFLNFIGPARLPPEPFQILRRARLGVTVGPQFRF